MVSQELLDKMNACRCAANDILVGLRAQISTGDAAHLFRPLLNTLLGLDPFMVPAFVECRESVAIHAIYEYRRISDRCCLCSVKKHILTPPEFSITLDGQIQ